MVMVAARDHPLAKYEGTIPKSELAKHVQLVLTDRSSLSKGREFGVMSPSTWRLADLFAKHAFLLNGLGWGGMPMHVVQDDLAAGRLVELQIEDIPPGGHDPADVGGLSNIGAARTRGPLAHRADEALLRQTSGDTERQIAARRAAGEKRYA